MYTIVCSQIHSFHLQTAKWMNVDVVILEIKTSIDSTFRCEEYSNVIILKITCQTEEFNTVLRNWIQVLNSKIVLVEHYLTDKCIDVISSLRLPILSFEKNIKDNLVSRKLPSKFITLLDQSIKNSVVFTEHEYNTIKHNRVVMFIDETNIDLAKELSMKVPFVGIKTSKNISIDIQQIVLENIDTNKIIFSIARILILPPSFQSKRFINEALMYGIPIIYSIKNHQTHEIESLYNNESQCLILSEENKEKYNLESEDVSSEQFNISFFTALRYSKHHNIIIIGKYPSIDCIKDKYNIFHYSQSDIEDNSNLRDSDNENKLISFIMKYNIGKSIQVCENNNIENALKDLIMCKMLQKMYVKTIIIYPPCTSDKIDLRFKMFDLVLTSTKMFEKQLISEEFNAEYLGIYDSNTIEQINISTSDVVFSCLKQDSSLIYSTLKRKAELIVYDFSNIKKYTMDNGIFKSTEKDPNVFIAFDSVDILTILYFLKRGIPILIVSERETQEFITNNTNGWVCTKHYLSEKIQEVLEEWNFDIHKKTLDDYNKRFHTKRYKQRLMKCLDFL